MGTVILIALVAVIIALLEHTHRATLRRGRNPWAVVGPQPPRGRPPVRARPVG